MKQEKGAKSINSHRKGKRERGALAGEIKAREEITTKRKKKSQRQNLKQTPQ